MIRYLSKTWKPKYYFSKRTSDLSNHFRNCVEMVLKLLQRCFEAISVTYPHRNYKIVSKLDFKAITNVSSFQNRNISQIDKKFSSCFTWNKYFLKHEENMKMKTNRRKQVRKFIKKFQLGRKNVLFFQRSYFVIFWRTEMENYSTRINLFHL